MKKEAVALLVILMVLGYGCTQPLPEAEQQPAGPTIAKDISGISEEPPETQPIAEETLPKTEEKTESVVEDKNNFQIFNPVLTYEGAYNGPLYGTSEQVGSASMDSYFENLDRNGINFFIGMFGISGEPTADTLVSDQELGEVIAAAQKHPYRIIPFFNPGIGGEEVEQYLGEELTGMYTKTLEASQGIVGKEFIRGFGEVETQEWSARHNDPKVLQLVTLAQRNNLHFMFHPVAGKMDDVEKIIEAYPDTTFLMHLFREDLAQSTDKLITLLKEHDNLYYSMDAAHIIHDNNMDLIYDYDSPNQQSSIAKLVSAYDSKEKIMTQSAIQAYKPLVDAAPDKVMWGTEIGPEYAFDPQVFDRAIKISRFVIAGFDEKDREAVGYKNALRVFGEGVVADSRIKVLDTRSWPECTDAQMGDCDASCDIPVTNALTAEQEECSLNCFMGKQCREVLEMDVG